MRWSASALLLGAALSGALAANDMPACSGPPSAHHHELIRSLRRPDSEWQHVVKGAQLDSKQSGELANYKMRTDKVDPSKLGVDKGVKQYSGYLDDEKKDKHLFYWFFESRNDPDNDPIILWLNGGPGCSSMRGLLSGLGPATIDENLEVVHNPYSWNNNASVMFLDQPVNVGFSYSNQTVNNTEAAGEDIYALLTLFFEEFPEYAHQDFHLAGQSYAGHYVPNFAAEILSHEDSNIGLTSILIGNGLTDPLTQYAHYRPMACGEGGFPAVLNYTTCKAMADALPQCQAMIKECAADATNKQACLRATSFCNAVMLGPFEYSGRNVYDMRLVCDNGTCNGDSVDHAALWLNKTEVKDTLGVEVPSFSDCSDEVYDHFMSTGDLMRPTHLVVPSLLERIPVLVFAGDTDYICNWLGNLAWTSALQWPGHDAFNKAQPRVLRTAMGNKDYGEVKAAGGLVFMRIFDAGHAAPLDQPEASLDFVNRWLAGEWTSD